MRHPHKHNLYVVSLSGGASSAAAYLRALAIYPKDDVCAVFADTNIEHEDTYRFLNDIERLTGKVTHRINSGKTPFDISEEHNMIFNSRIAGCTQELKSVPIRKYVRSLQNDDTRVFMCIGFNIDDRYRKANRLKPYGRLPAPIKTWAEIGVAVKYPLWVHPRVIDPMSYVESFGLTLPLSYRVRRDTGLNFSSNCGGTCFKAGIKYWRDAIVANPTAFQRALAWENKMRLRPECAEYSILKSRKGGTVTAYPLQTLYEETMSGDDLALKRLRMSDDIESDCVTECQVF